MHMTTRLSDTESDRAAAQGALKLGIDIGSKTIKVVVLDDEDRTLYFFYDRHLSNVKQTLLYALKRTRIHCADRPLTVGVTGSAGIQCAKLLGLPFVQEVLADKLAIGRLIPEVDVAIELGGEDSKILFLSGGEELRMNNTCAGGTGGFIDTIAGMFDLNADEFNSLALGCRTVYPIASRCAVFAQSDVRPLLNEGVSRYDIAGSVFAAVATQCISGLACGRRIIGRVALLGGPFHFLSELRKAFRDALGPEASAVEAPVEAHLFVAKGAAFHAENSMNLLTMEELEARLAAMDLTLDKDDERLPALFSSEAEYADFKARHDAARPLYGQLNGYEGKAYLGIDSGSTTIKCVLIGEGGQFLFAYYERVAGDLIEAAELMLRKLYRRLPRLHDGRPAVTIAHTCVTGYGEDFLLQAFQADSSEVETVAHLRAARECVPDVEMILDVGGQDIKYLTVRNGALNDIVLNDACSSGCGALIGGFAYSMNVKLQEFTEAALFAEQPVDLGTRCTVFMTSRVRHAQKEGASVGEISAGLAYSVVRNALFKVIRLSDKTCLKKNIVVQGGTFKSDAVLRAFERMCGCNVYRSGASEYMGAYGAALLARERASKAGDVHTALLSTEELDRLVVKRSTKRCELCSNRCVLTLSEFSEMDSALSIAKKRQVNNLDVTVLGREGSKLGICPEASDKEIPEQKASEKRETRRLIIGNRCARPLGCENGKDPDVINLFEYTYDRVFSYKSKRLGEAKRGNIGVLRALNMYDDYPLWHTFLTRLGFRVVLSDPSGRGTYLQGAQTILSESACYPFKISNGHLLSLVDQGLDTVFCPYVEKGFSGKLSCPVLAQLPLVLRLNIEAVYQGRVRLISPHLDYCDQESMVEELHASFVEIDPTITRVEIEAALPAGLRAYEEFRADVRDIGSKALQAIRESGGHGVILACRPYHLDPEMHHGLPDQLLSFGLSVLTAESVEHIAEKPPSLYVDDLWEFPSRVYTAAQSATECDCLDFIELYSFGCGLDSVAVDQARAILETGGKLFTSLKVDEMIDLSATRMRMRSMLAALNRDGSGLVFAEGSENAGRDRDAVGSAASQMKVEGDSAKTDGPAGFQPEAGGDGASGSHMLVDWLPGYAAEMVQVQPSLRHLVAPLPQEGASTVLSGLSHANNDICFSSLYAVGQVMSGVDETRNTINGQRLQVLIPSTCTGCRADDLPGLIRKALADVGYSNTSASLVSDCIRNTADSDSSCNRDEVARASKTLLLLQLRDQLAARLRPYLGDAATSETLATRLRPCLGDAEPSDSLGRPWIDLSAASDEQAFLSQARQMLDTARKLLPAKIQRKPLVSLVGSAPTVFNTTLNNDTALQIEAAGCETSFPWFNDYILYRLSVGANDGTSGRETLSIFEHAAERLAEAIEAEAARHVEHIEAADHAGHAEVAEHVEPLVHPPRSIDCYRHLAVDSGLVSEHETSGVGWLYVGHVLDAIQSGVRNIIYMHSFGCLPAHTVGRGIFRELRSRNADLNIVSIEYDPGASGVNQSNRIKLLTSLAKLSLDVRKSLF